ncbi:phosphatidylinositol N-acetylglucosaminyltransferase subunit A [Elysia marginata]|uniref:Phosphatidylinositol N-acetylglucosaminyltransferase subunit A n=1 Tax=Elysia marginata TaxID=1093978 RepID=A0AAV4GQG9_9GAST|nr:phosphatidylinositol N-acetylglucosaminyltransferase subunit A [Elysia marginata]
MPPGLIYLAEPTSEALTKELEKAIEDRIAGRQPDPFELHKRIKTLYSWRHVASRTESVYHTVQDTPLPDLSTRLQHFRQCGPVSGKLFMLTAILNLVWLLVLQYIWPAESIEPAEHFGDVKGCLPNLSQNDHTASSKLQSRVSSNTPRKL